MKNKGFKRIAFVMLLAAFLMTAGLTFAYWYNYQDTKTDGQTIEVGKGLEVSLKVEINDKVHAGKNLVPAGMAQHSVGGTELNTEKIVLTYNLTTEINEQDVPYTSISYKVEVKNRNTSLLNIRTDINVNIVTVTITLTEPDDEVAYNKIQRLGTLTFELIFTATVTP